MALLRFLSVKNRSVGFTYTFHIWIIWISHESHMWVSWMSHLSCSCGCICVCIWEWVIFRVHIWIVWISLWLSWMSHLSCSCGCKCVYICEWVTFRVWHEIHTGWQKCIGCLTLQVSFRQRATKYRTFSREMTCKDKASRVSSPPCTSLTCACMWARVRACIDIWIYVCIV